MQRRNANIQNNPFGNNGMYYSLDRDLMRQRTRSGGYGQGLVVFSERILPKLWGLARLVWEKLGVLFRSMYVQTTAVWRTNAFVQQNRLWIQVGFAGVLMYVITAYDLRFHFNMGSASAVSMVGEGTSESSLAPVSSKAMSAEEVSVFIDHYKGIARSQMKKHGVPASIALAQALIESRAGKSKLAVQNNNFFGIKCFSKSCKRGHCTNFTDDTHKDFFRKYAYIEDSWQDHSLFLKRPNYKHLFEYGKDYKKWAWGLKGAGYATDPSYAVKLIEIIERYDLHKFDN